MSSEELQENFSRMDHAAEKPWVVLTAGVDFPVFEKQLGMAVKAGASGDATGRAVFKEALTMVSPEEQDRFLRTEGVRRMKAMNTLIDQHATPVLRHREDGVRTRLNLSWEDLTTPKERWFETYPEHPVAGNHSIPPAQLPTAEEVMSQNPMFDRNSSAAVINAYQNDTNPSTYQAELATGREYYRNLPLGKLLGLRGVTNERGLANIMAMDQSNSFRRFLKARERLKRMSKTDAGYEPAYREYIEAKKALAEELGDLPTGLLIDLPYAGLDIVTEGLLPRNTGWLVRLEKSYDPALAELEPGLTVAKIKRMGATAVKLLVYMDVEDPVFTRPQLEFVREVAIAAHREGILLLVEELTFPRKGEDKNSPEFSERQKFNAIQSAKLLRPFTDVLKLEPVVGIQDVNGVTVNFGTWVNAAAGRRAWVVLSAGEEFDQFTNKFVQALDSGAMGGAVGRANWQEFFDVQDERGREWLRTTARGRLRKLSQLIEDHATPWMDRFGLTHDEMAAAISSGWHRGRERQAGISQEERARAQDLESIKKEFQVRNIKLYVLDFDGTLRIGDGDVPQSVIDEAIKQLEQGTYIAISTGARHQTIYEKFIQHIPPQHWNKIFALGKYGADAGQFTLVDGKAKWNPIWEPISLKDVITETQKNAGKIQTALAQQNISIVPELTASETGMSFSFDYTNKRSITPEQKQEGVKLLEQLIFRGKGGHVTAGRSDFDVYPISKGDSLRRLITYFQQNIDRSLEPSNIAVADDSYTPYAGGYSLMAEVPGVLSIFAGEFFGQLLQPSTHRVYYAPKEGPEGIAQLMKLHTQNRRSELRLSPTPKIIPEVQRLPVSDEHMTAQERQIDQLLKQQGRDQAQMRAVVDLVSFQFIEPHLAGLFGPYFAAAIFGMSVSGIPISAAVSKVQEVKVRDQIEKFRLQGPADMSLQTPRTVVLVQIKNKFPRVSLETMRLPQGSRVVVLQPEGSQPAGFKHYEKARIPGVSIVRSAYRSAIPNLTQLQKILSVKPNSIPIVVFPDDFNALDAFKFAARRPGFVARSPRRPDAQIAFSDLLGQTVPKTLLKQVRPELLNFQIYDNALSPISIPFAHEGKFVEFWLSLLSQKQAAAQERARAA